LNTLFIFIASCFQGSRECSYVWRSRAAIARHHTLNLRQEQAMGVPDWMGSMVWHGVQRLSRQTCKNAESRKYILRGNIYLTCINTFVLYNQIIVHVVKKIISDYSIL